ncbi:MAG: zinc-binding dehydrogenase [Thermoleophilia bacterium]|nr:zinc-binding dehydrogenase [Thermoleophilia bacterium]
MRQALFHGPGAVRLVEVPMPVPGPGEVLVKVEVALVCGTDAKTFRRGHPLLLEHAPAPFGHEYCGVVVEVGTEVTAFAAGDRVASANSAPCGRCFFCRRDQFSLCEHLQPLLNGAYADYLLVPAPIVAVNMFKVPKRMAPGRAAFLEPLACVLKGLEVGEIGPGTTVGVVGLGPIGLLMVYAASHRGARVIAVGRNDLKLETAGRLGAGALVDLREPGDALERILELTDEGRGVDVAIEAVGRPEVWDFAVSMVRRGGVVNFFGGCEEGSVACVDTYRLHYEELHLTAAFHHTPRHVRMAMDVLANRDFPDEALTTHRYTLEELVTPLRVMNKELAVEGFIKAAVTP